MYEYAPWARPVENARLHRVTGIFSALPGMVIFVNKNVYIRSK